MKAKKLTALLTATAVVVFLTACVPVVTENEFNGLQQQYNQLESAFGADEAQITFLKGELKVTLLDQLLFPEGDYKLNLYAKSILDKLVPTLLGLQQTKVVVGGYTDNIPIGPRLKREGVTTNLDLSSRRADGVVNYLLSRNVNLHIISAQGFGESNPVASNDTPGGRAKNRRIEITLVGNGK